jgi:DNA-directed RNA polymerase subunit RPC12/RpoP
MNDQPTYGRNPPNPIESIAVPEGLVFQNGGLECMTCTWTYDDWHGYYDTTCGDAFWLAEEWTDKFKFCPYCGGRISLASKNEPASEGESCK